MTSPIIPQKQCTKCKQYFPSTGEYFYSCIRYKCGLHPWCKSCAKRLKPKEIIPNGMKKCPRCESILPADNENFRTSKHTSDGFFNYCIPCGREKGRIDQKKFRDNNKQKLSIKGSIRRKKRQDKDPELERAKARAKYKRRMFDPEGRKKLQDKGIRNNAKRKSAKVNNTKGNDFTTQDVELQFKSQKGKCWWCGCKLKKYHVDHRYPIAKGGDNSAGNICIACPTCNCSKNDKMPWEWIGRLL